AAVAAITLLVNSVITGNVSKEIAGEKVVEFLDSLFFQQGMDTKGELDSIRKVSGLYEVNVKYDEEIITVYITVDGEYIIPEGALTPVVVIEQQLDEQQISNLSEEEIEVLKEEIAGFVECLKKAGLKIYGANWCGWTEKTVGAFGGFDAVKPIYVECTENQQLCQEKEIGGYPTILINDKSYTGPRTFEGYAEATGCEAVLEFSEQSTSNGGSC
ncbi:unnamed protein product, partial [marine sediment metagenome]